MSAILIVTALSLASPMPASDPALSSAPGTASLIPSAYSLSAAPGIADDHADILAAPPGTGVDDLPVAAGRETPRAPYSGATLGRDLGAARWEMGGIAAIVLLPRIYRRAQGSRGFHFQSEGWFGRDTYEVGLDKTLHAWKAYVITDVVQSIISRRTGDDRSAAVAAGLFGFGLTTLAELNDGFSKTTGFSHEDEIAQVAGIGLSMVRNIVPGLRDKIDYRLLLKPKFNGELSDTRGRATNSKYLLALQLAGFEKLEQSPMRFVELQVGYYARGFSEPERLRGDAIRRHLFVGVGFNLQQLFARSPNSAPERIVKGALDYIQLPYTSTIVKAVNP